MAINILYLNDIIRRVSKTKLIIAIIVLGISSCGPGLDITSEGLSLFNKFISTGEYHTCTLFDDGNIKCWGYNYYGQLGLGDDENRGDEPGEMGDNLLTVDLGTDFDVAQIVSGLDHNCAKSTKGDVKCWGSNDYGQLGLGDDEHRGDDPGEMGDNLPTVDLGEGVTVKSLYAGTNTCAILGDDSIKCWGYNGEGQLGLGDDENRGDEPGEMGDNLPTVDLGTDFKPVQLALGYDHTCAKSTAGDVKCWGYNRDGVLGLGDELDRGDEPGEMGDNLPAVDLGTGRSALYISASWDHTCALLDDGGIKCWGENDDGELGLGDGEHRGDEPGEMGDNLPAVDLGVIEKPVSVVASYRLTCALFEDGRIKCWGRGDEGQLANEADDINLGDEPGEMGDNLDFIDLGSDFIPIELSSGGSYAICAFSESKNIRCWGGNEEGELGQGTNENFGDSPGELVDQLPNVVL